MAVKHLSMTSTALLIDYIFSYIKFLTVSIKVFFFISWSYSFQEVYLVYILNELAGNSFIIFCSTCIETQTMAIMLRGLGFMAIPLHGQMNQVGLIG